MDTFTLYKKDKYSESWSDAELTEIRERIVNAFKELEFFPEPHKYYLHGKELMSVSNVAHRFKTPFDKDLVATRTFNKYYDNPRSPYYKKTVEEIKAMWDKNNMSACENGKEHHDFGESCFWFMTGNEDKISSHYRDRLTSDGGFMACDTQEIAVAQFWDSLPADVMPILCENKICREDLGYAGTFDLLLYHEGKFIIADYKTNKDLHKHSYGRKMLAPFNDMDENDESLYTLQLSLYQLALEHIGLDIKDLRLIWLNPEGGYKEIRLTSHAEQFETYLRSHPL